MGSGISKEEKRIKKEHEEEERKEREMFYKIFYPQKFINECLENGYEIKSYKELIEMSKEKFNLEEMKIYLRKEDPGLNEIKPFKKNCLFVLLCCNNFKDAAIFLTSTFSIRYVVYVLIIDYLLKNKNIEMFEFVSELIKKKKYYSNHYFMKIIFPLFKKLCINGNLDELKLLSKTFDLTSNDFNSLEPNIGTFLYNIKDHQDVLNWLIYDFKITTNENLIIKFGNKDFLFF